MRVEEMLAAGTGTVGAPADFINNCRDALPRSVEWDRALPGG
jgi:hypothetical protein